MKRISTAYWLPLSLLAGVLLLAVWAFSPGLHGPFLFDDWANLPQLGQFGPVDDWSVFWRYLTAGTADPTGRPVAQLSFLLDAQHWPADPYPFKRNNLLLHLFNGLLLYLLVVRLERLMDGNRLRSRWIALLTAALWLLHPLWVSTVFYVVQRQAMLVATWTLQALLGYLHGRRLLAQRPRDALVWMSLSVGLGTVLAVLSKGNGALLPLLVGLVEWIVLRPQAVLAPPPAARRLWLGWQWAFLWLPALVLLSWLLAGIPGDAASAERHRSFTLGQRLLTEPRVLLDYLRLLFLPRPYTRGLFNDAYPFSTDLWHPWTTLPALLAVLALGVGAWRLRKREPALALAVLFFFAGHLMESTVIPLELYFEHRNYVPALLLFWPPARWLLQARILSRAARFGLAVGLPALLAVLTWMRADLWGNGTEQARLWARLNPDSPRAQTQVALYEMKQHRLGSAVARLRAVLAGHPDSVQAALNLLNALCQFQQVQAGDLQQAREALARARHARRLLQNWLLKLLDSGSRCPGLDRPALMSLLDAARSNVAFDDPDGRKLLFYLRGRVALWDGAAQEAATFFRHAIEADPQPGAVLELSATLARAGHLQAALELLQFGRRRLSAQPREGWSMQAVHRWLLRRQGYWAHEFRYLESQIRADLSRQKDAHD